MTALDANALRAQLEGFDVDGALARLGGMESLYVEVLGSFCDDEAGRVEEASAAVAANDNDAAARAIHTLKGLAGTIGATQLEQAALALESALRDNAAGDQLEPLLGKCGAELSAAIALVRALS